MGDLTRYLALAEYAVKHVEAVMSKGPGPFNRTDEVVHRVLNSFTATGPQPSPFEMGASWAAQQKVLQQARPAELRQFIKEGVDKKVTGMSTWIEQCRNTQKSTLISPIQTGNEDEAVKAVRIGAIVEKSGLGNCGEQSRVAFKYLVTKGAPGIAIVDWGRRVDPVGSGLPERTGNHTFVVIGMRPGLPDVMEGSLEHPPAWGKDAVVCDPWYHEWFHAAAPAEWQRKMKRILGETLSIKPQDPWLNKKVAEKTGGAMTDAYRSNIAVAWRFERQAYLSHLTPTLTRLAGGIPLQDQRAAHYRGHPL